MSSFIAISAGIIVSLFISLIETKNSWGCPRVTPVRFDPVALNGNWFVVEEQNWQLEKPASCTTYNFTSTKTHHS